jgi:hypothetical protein
VFPPSPPYHHTAHLVKSGEKIMIPQHWIHWFENSNSYGG